MQNGQGVAIWPPPTLEFYLDGPLELEFVFEIRTREKKIIYYSNTKSSTEQYCRQAEADQPLGCCKSEKG